jgi:hypothetical protein
MVQLGRASISMISWVTVASGWDGTSTSQKNVQKRPSNAVEASAGNVFHRLTAEIMRRAP